jgi:Flp pilus assembly protein TadG
MMRRALIARFAQENSGAVAVIFAVILPVMILAVGAGVDFSRAMQARAALQNAVDAAALGSVVSYAATGGLTGNSAAATTIAQGYESSSGVVLPASVSSIAWGSPTFAAPTVTSSGTYTPYYATVSATGTVKMTFLAGFIPTITVAVTAKAAVPVNDLSGAGNCITNAGDYNALYVYNVPRGMIGTYVPNISKLTNSQILFTDMGATANTCKAGTYMPPPTTNILGFALVDVTAGKSSGATGCDYNYFNETGDNDYQTNMNNNQYGSQCQSANWLFSTAWPPSAATTQATAAISPSGNTYTSNGYVSCASASDCSGSTDTSEAQLYYWNAGKAGYPGATGTNNALQIYQMTGNINASSGPITEPTSGTTLNYNYSQPPPYASAAAPKGICLFSQPYCTAFASSTSQAQTLLTYGALDCSQHGGKTYMFFWNDMGGYPEDMDYGNLNYYYSCGNTANSTSQMIGYFAFLAQ